MSAAPVTHHELVDLGMTYRQLDHWVRQGWLRAHNPGCGSGRDRTFPRSELTVAKTMVALVKAGVGPAAAHRAARNDGQLASGVRVTVKADS